jgi:dTDP-4-dehydrorhamnose reductase
MTGVKVLVTGATGMLGSRVIERLSESTPYEITSIGRHRPAANYAFVECDLSDLPAFSEALDDIKPSIIIHCAANVNVNACENDRDYTYRVHVGTCEVIASKSFVVKTIYISTDAVFDGEEGNYSIDDRKNPVNYYSLTKSLGEDKLLASGKSVIIRTNIFGFRFPMQQSLFEWAYQSLLAGKETPGFTNIRFNPLYVGSLAGLIVGAISGAAPGVYHFGCQAGLSKYEFIKQIAATFQLDPSLVKMTVAQSVAGVKRPGDTTLNTTETARRLGISFPSIAEEMIRISKDLRDAKRV